MSKAVWTLEYHISGDIECGPELCAVFSSRANAEDWMWADIARHYGRSEDDYIITHAEVDPPLPVKGAKR